MFCVLFGTIFILDYYMILKIKEIKRGLPYEIKKDVQKGINCSDGNTSELDDIDK